MRSGRDPALRTRVRVEPTGGGWRRGLLFAGLAVYLVCVLKNAWVCDDAYILFRRVENAVYGHGLTWNPAERVQTYTTPHVLSPERYGPEQNYEVLLEIYREARERRSA